MRATPDNVEPVEVDIVLPCYEAAAWIDGFIGGLLEVRDIRWRVLARDDASRDGTAACLRQWRDRLGDRMTILDDGDMRNLGVIGNYDRLLAATAAPWILTADPDDVWLPVHMETVLGALLTAEAAHGTDMPIAVCADAQVVDAALAPIADSYWRWSRTRPARHRAVPRTAIDNAALGSTMAINRALLQRALPLPSGAAYQDWWLALVATAFGRLIAVPDATIQYRRHQENLTRDPYSATLPGMVARLSNAPRSAHDRVRFIIHQAARQARAFVDRYEGDLPVNEMAALRALADLPGMGPLRRRRAVLRHNLWFNSPLKNLGLLLLV